MIINIYLVFIPIRSNCDYRIANKLRSHYEKPYFLPNDSESIRTDWIFMGTPNNGAHMHVSRIEFLHCDYP